MADVTENLDKKSCYAVNARSVEGMDHLLAGTQQLHCRSDVDSQLILHFAFNSSIRLQSLILTAPADHPTTIKIYTNRATFGFDDVDSIAPAQSFQGLTVANFGAEVQLKLKQTAFTRVNNLFLFCDREGEDTCALTSIKFIGTGQDVADMSKLKKIGHEEAE